MMDFMRRYGGYIFVVPVAIFFLDDYMTNWHDHGHERVLYIVLENAAEDLVTFLFWWAVWAWENRTLPHIHAECPKCHFKWVMHPKQRMLHCPRCGLPEPS